jgi:hypothetical protein
MQSLDLYELQPLDPQMATLPPFDDVYRAVRRSLRDAGLVER